MIGKSDDLKAKLTDEHGNTLEYEPYAFMSYDGEQYIIMRATTQTDNVGDEILVLKAEQGLEGKPIFTVVDKDANMDQILYDGLGITGDMLN